MATDVCVKGNCNLNGGSTSTPMPQTNCPVKADPLASLAEPAYGGCNFNDLVISSSVATLNPGVYCSKLEIQNGAVVTLNPGTYVFLDTVLIINSGGRLTGNGVMLYFNGDSGIFNANRIDGACNGNLPGHRAVPVASGNIHHIFMKPELGKVPSLMA